MKKVLILLISVSFFYSFLFAQNKKTTVIPKDPGAIDLIGLGKRYLKNTNYPQALRMFEDAMIRGYSQSTTTAIYLVGLSYYQMGDLANARQYFQILQDEYPLSRYVEEAKYNLALVDLKDKDENKQISALITFFTLYDQVADGELSKECGNIAKNYIFEKAPSTLLKKLYEKSATTLPKFRQDICEALCYRLVQEDKKAEAKEIVNKYVASGAKKTDFLNVLLMEKKTYPKPKERNITKIALFLPLYVDNTDVNSLSEIPAKSQVALELYEGFQKAVEEYSSVSKKQIYVKVYDTQRDNNILGTQLADMEDLYPDVIVGEIFNKQSRFIAEWAESKGVTQIVPISPTLSITEGKPHVLMARPSAATHGKRMANFAYNVMGIRKVAVWNDKKSVTLDMANAFDKEFKSLGGQTVPIQIDSLYQRSIGQIPYSMNAVKNSGCDGMYIPIGNEESIGLIMSYMGSGSSLKVMTSPDIESFYTMDRELKEKVGIYYTTSYLPDEGSQEYVSFYNAFLARYGVAPTESNLRGYDVAKYLLTVLDGYTKEQGEVNEYIRKHDMVKGIHINFDFDGQSDNQAVHIMQYTRGGVTKRK